MDLESKLGIIGGGANHDHGIHPEAFRLAADLVERARIPDASAGKCPADGRIESFLGEYFRDLGLTEPLRLAAEQLVLPRHGVARELSIPEGEDSYRNPILRSYRVRNGVLHNPRSDRRTTSGTFHVAKAGCRSPATRRPYPRSVFAALFRHALSPPDDLLVVPFTANRPEPVAGVRLAAAPADGLPRGARRLRREDDGGPLLRPGRPGEQPRLRRVDLRQRRRPAPAGERRRAGRRALDRPHRLRHPRAAPDPADQEGARAAGLGQRDRAAAAGRHVLARPGRAVQRRPGVQGHLPRRRPASSSP